ncbi:MAG TPA: tetratricopeptide repeat protein [Stellaceae bacterium]|nr:tetratricopeptide repeat protein [Stellaceae bacterium]
MFRALSANQNTPIDLQTPFDAAVVIPTVLRPSLERAVRSIYAQDIKGRVQILIGIDAAQGDMHQLDRLAAECPGSMALCVLEPGYSTSVRHGGLHANRFSGALRTILTYLANSRCVAYLDDDNWWGPAHLSSLKALIDGGAGWAWSDRWFVDEATGTPLAVDDWESVGPGKGVFTEKFGGFIDTSTLVIDKLACEAAVPLWSMSPFEDGSGEDRLVFQALVDSGKPGKSSGQATSYYRMDHRDSMHLNRLQALRERGVILPSEQKRGVVRLADAVAGFRGLETPAPKIPPADDLLVRELVQRLKPMEVLALGLGDEIGVFDIAGWAIATNDQALTLLVDSGPVLNTRIRDLGFNNGIAALPPDVAAKEGGALRWLAAANLSVDLVYIGAKPAVNPKDADAIVETVAAGWAALRAGGMMIGEGAVEDGGVLGVALKGFAERSGVDLLPAVLHGHHRWLLQKGDAAPEDESVEALYDKGVAAHGAGDLQTANRYYQAALAKQTDHAPTLHMMGVMALQLGKIDAAVQLTGAAVELMKDSAAFYNDHGEALRHAGRFDDAAQAYEAAMTLDPTLGSICNNFGILRQAQGRMDEAVPLFRRAVELMPGSPTAPMNLGVALMEKGDIDGAVEVLRQAEAMAATTPAVKLNLANALMLQGDPVAAEALYREVIDLEPHSLDAGVNLARALREQGRLDESLTIYRLIEDNLPAELDAARPILSFNKGLTELVAGDLAGGWRGWAERARAGAAPEVSLSTPRWKGEPLKGKRLLIHAEQGLGDTLQFIRFIPALRKKLEPASLSLIVQQPLLPLLQAVPNAGWLGLDALNGPEQALPVHDLYVSLLDLAGLLGIDLAALPVAEAYVEADAAAVTSWRARLETLDGRKVGLVWKGRKEHGNDRNRSMPATAVAPLLQLDGVSWVSLQKEAGEVEKAVLESHGFIADVASELTDMAATAALVAALDLVITVDTSVAHLAGAMGKPVWLLLPHAPDWRWMLERSDSPWYPSARLFRQPSPGDWAGVVKAVEAALNERA